MKARFTFSFLLAAVTLLTTTFLSLNSNAAQSDFDETQLIPSSAMVAVIAHPKTILNDPTMELVPREIITVLGKKELGFDPCEMSKAMVLVDSFDNLESPPGFALVMAFDSDQGLSESLTERMTKGDMDGMTIYRPKSPEEPAILLPNSRTIIVGMEPFIGKMMAAKGAQSQLITLINAKGTDAHISGFWIVEPVRGLINDNLPPKEQIPMPFQGFRDLPDLLDTISITHNFSGAGSQLEIAAIDEKAAGQVERIIRQGITMGRQMAMGYVANEMRGEDPELQEAVQVYGERLGNFLDKEFRPERVDNTLLFANKDNQQTAQLTNVATVGILVGLLLPAVQQVREAARRTQSMNNLRQIALACINYESVNKKFPSNIVDADGNPLLSWRVAILPFMEENELYKQFHLDEPWDSEHNIQLLDQMPETFVNPNIPSNGTTVYLGFSGEGTIFGSDDVTFGNITDGSSNTILAVEANADAAIEWSRPQDIPFDRSNDIHSVGQLRPGGFNSALCDGSCHFFSNDLDQETLKNMIQRNDGNVVNAWDR